MVIPYPMALKNAPPAELRHQCLHLCDLSGMRSPLRRTLGLLRCDPAGELLSERLGLAQPYCSRLGRLTLQANRGMPRLFRDPILTRCKPQVNRRKRGLLRRKLGGVRGLLRR